MPTNTKCVIVFVLYFLLVTIVNGRYHKYHIDVSERSAQSIRLGKRDQEMVMNTGSPQRESAFVIFSRFMTRQSGQAPPVDQEALVDRLFSLFDMNENGKIERNEFKAMLLLLGVIRSM